MKRSCYRKYVVDKDDGDDYLDHKTNAMVLSWREMGDGTRKFGGFRLSPKMATEFFERCARRDAIDDACTRDCISHCRGDGVPDMTS